MSGIVKTVKKEAFSWSASWRGVCIARIFAPLQYTQTQLDTGIGWIEL